MSNSNSSFSIETLLQIEPSEPPAQRSQDTEPTPLTSNKPVAMSLAERLAGKAIVVQTIDLVKNVKNQSVA